MSGFGESNHTVRKRWGMRSAIALVAMALVVAGCGNTDGDGGGASGDAEGAEVSVQAPGVTDTEIRVGGVASVTNPLGGSYGDAFTGVQAYFDMVNENGGVHGRNLVLAEQRDDKLANNKSEIEGMLSEGEVFAVLPIASLLFTGADTLVQAGVPAFGWTINQEWQGTPENPRLNLFGQSGSFLCFECPNPMFPWVAQHLEAQRVGVLAYSVPQSASCADGIEASFAEYGSMVDAEVVFSDKALSYGVNDLSVQMNQMKEEGVDLIMTCMDLNGVVTVANEREKQDLDAVQFLPNGYSQTFVEEFGDLFEGSIVRTDFAMFELEEKPEGLQTYLDAMEEAGAEPSENSMVGWLNADLFVRGLEEAGPDFDRQKVIDSINSLTNYDANGILYGVDWTKQHTEPGASCHSFAVIEDSEFQPIAEPGAPFVCISVEGNEVTHRFDA